MKFEYEGAHASLLQVNERTYKVVGLLSTMPGQGHAKNVMQQICAYADDHFLDLVLIAKRFYYSDANGLSNKELIRFYKKFGFVQGNGAANDLIRYV